MTPPSRPGAPRWLIVAIVVLAAAVVAGGVVASFVAHVRFF